MTTWDRRRLVIAAAATVAAIAAAVALSGAARGAALYAYVLLLVGIAVIAIGSRVRTAWPPTPRFDRLIPAQPAPPARIHQLEGLAGRVAGGSPSAFDLYHRVRPLVREIVAARLARKHGVDLDRRPDRARQLVGPWTWELVRPDLEPPTDSWAPTWSTGELETMVTELEAL